HVPNTRERLPRRTERSSLLPRLRPNRARRRHRSSIADGRPTLRAARTTGIAALKKRRAAPDTSSSRDNLRTRCRLDHAEYGTLSRPVECHRLDHVPHQRQEQLIEWSSLADKCFHDSELPGAIRRHWSAARHKMAKRRSRNFQLAA